MAHDVKRSTLWIIDVLHAAIAPKEQLVQDFSLPGDKDEVLLAPLWKTLEHFVVQDHSTFLCCLRR